ncbi:N-acetylmuramoyl-L-alanine amidase [Flavobacterium sp.]|uniref:N-acetylmuramoyl-L-alanine amidase family protein n=1 Tax=Flavobacterium sp. TaxID=239 RepID=UPI0008CEF21E|nr:N-acetylmuramoyl-L-alanine amidase [Flavobacterium sp.]OGS63429.1 MAG: N-acetylmuramoyl-L-alanine amidase [Flavobacteria bacterium GWF1_32_7]HBD27221.1 N-acetylmuramoyl-L-alanine amidase [Flavobacterium sp.]
MFKRIVFVAIAMHFLSGYSQGQKFKVVLDAGHGGKDYGAVYHGNIEKNIALQTTLRVGAILEKDPQIDVVYTRKSDVFIELQQRANIANKSKGSIFVSMHCNANKNQAASGNETYVMGITRNASNLEVAKNENEVVTLETDYKIKYDGFDPNSPESVIGISILQEEHLDQSIELAGRVQEFFTKKTDNKNRGVKQAGFLVLRQITMPRVLVEMGFVSNKEEGEFLNSEDGQNKLAEAIAGAILDYKNEFFNPSNNDNVKEDIKIIDKKEETIVKETPKKEEIVKKVEKATEKGIVFKIQISASTKELATSPSNFKGLSPISVESTGSLFKYFYASEKNYDAAKQKLEEAKQKGYKTAFIVAYKDGIKINVTDAIK